MCESGRMERPTMPLPIGKTLAVARTLLVLGQCGGLAPFRLPVVPEVETTVAALSGFGLAGVSSNCVGVGSPSALRPLTATGAKLRVRGGSFGGGSLRMRL